MFSYSKNFKFASCLGVHLWISLLIYCNMPFFVLIASMPCFSKVCSVLCSIWQKFNVNSEFFHSLLSVACAVSHERKEQVLICGHFIFCGFQLFSTVNLYWLFDISAFLQKKHVVCWNFAESALAFIKKWLCMSSLNKKIFWLKFLFTNL